MTPQEIVEVFKAETPRGFIFIATFPENGSNGTVAMCNHHLSESEVRQVVMSAVTEVHTHYRDKNAKA